MYFVYWRCISHSLYFSWGWIIISPWGFLPWPFDKKKKAEKLLPSYRSWWIIVLCVFINSYTSTSLPHFIIFLQHPGFKFKEQCEFIYVSKLGFQLYPYHWHVVVFTVLATRLHFGFCMHNILTVRRFDRFVCLQYLWQKTNGEATRDFATKCPSLSIFYSVHPNHFNDEAIWMGNEFSWV